MLKFKFIVVDRTRAPFLREGESFYLERLRKYARVEWVEVKPVKIEKGRPTEDVLAMEEQRIAKRLSSHDYLVSLDRTGHQYTSLDLSSWLDRLSTNARDWVCFAIGGPLGLSKKLLARSHTVLSLSRLTLTHEMSRLFLLEQLYRAFTILQGEKSPLRERVGVRV
jgi:23S rRNA (pseudouridine1915-N3)-methyltransferase